MVAGFIGQEWAERGAVNELQPLQPRCVRCSGRGGFWRRVLVQGCHHFLYGAATSRVAAKIATSGAAHTFAGRRISTSRDSFSGLISHKSVRVRPDSTPLPSNIQGCHPSRRKLQGYAKPQTRIEPAESPMQASKDLILGAPDPLRTQ